MRAAPNMRVLFLQKYLPQEMLGVAWLCGALKRAGHTVQVLLLPDAEWEAKLSRAAPDLIACSLTTGDHMFHLRLAARAKEFCDAPIVFGGPHPTFVPDIALEAPVDFVCRGEGDGALPELCSTLENGGVPCGIANLSFKGEGARDGARVDNPVRALVSNLDEVENLHKLFPIAVRFPLLAPFVPSAIRVRALSRVYLALYLLWTEYLVCEQNQSVARATHTASLATLPPVDFVRRVSSKSVLELRESLFGRRSSNRRLRLEMEEDTIAHAGG